MVKCRGSEVYVFSHTFTMSLFHVKNCSLILLLLKVGAFESIPFFGLLGGLLGGGVAPPQVNPMYQPNPASFAQQPIAQNPNQQQPVNPYQQQPASPYQQQPWSLMPQHPTIFSPYGGGVIPNLSGGIFNAINGLSYSTQSMIGGLLGGIANIFGGAFPPPQPYFP